jgi:hypothetical protein
MHYLLNDTDQGPSMGSIEDNAIYISDDEENEMTNDLLERRNRYLAMLHGELPEEDEEEDEDYDENISSEEEEEIQDDMTQSIKEGKRAMIYSISSEGEEEEEVDSDMEMVHYSYQNGMHPGECIQ